MWNKEEYAAAVVCIVFFVCMFVVGKNQQTASAKTTNLADTIEVVNIRDMFIIKNAVLDSHEYYLFFDKNTGEFRGQEHKPECKTCFGIFD